MEAEPGSQTKSLEQDRKSKKDAKMTIQATDNREAAPMASRLRETVLRTILQKGQAVLQRPEPANFWLQLRGEAPEDRRIADHDRTLGLTHNLGGYPGEMVSFVGIYGTALG